MSQAWSHITIHSKQREDWCEWWTKMAANLNVFKTLKKDCILSKSNFSFAEVHWVIYRIRWENKNFDNMGTLNTNEKTIVSITKEKSPSPMRSLTLLPTFRGKNNGFFILTKFTVLCKSNASEMCEFRSLFTRTFQESSRESLSDDSRSFERNFPGTKNAISLNFRYETKFHDDKRRFTSSVPEISR